MATAPFKELLAMSDEELIELYDSAASTHGGSINHYREELYRRAQSEQTDAMLAYTKQLYWLTIIVTIATVLSLIAALIGLFR